MIDANAIAIAIGADQADFQIIAGNLLDACLGSRFHHLVSAMLKRLVFSVKYRMIDIRPELF